MAPRGTRFSANLVDNFAVLLPAMIAIVVGAAVSPPPESGLGLVVVLGVALSAVVSLGAQIAAQITWGQSIGKRMLGIKVVRTNGDPIELWRLILLRNVVVHVVAQLCGLMGLVDALLIFGDEQRCLHDYIADSRVVVVTES